MQEVFRIEDGIKYREGRVVDIIRSHNIKVKSDARLRVNIYKK